MTRTRRVLWLVSMIGVAVCSLPAAAVAASGWMTSGQLTPLGGIRGVGVDQAGTAQVFYSDPSGVFSTQRPRNGAWTPAQGLTLPPGLFQVKENAAGDLVAYSVGRTLQVAVRRGGVWGPTLTLATDADQRFGRKPQVLINDAGQVLVVWNSPKGIYARIRSVHGWGPVVRLAGPVRLRYGPAVAFNSRGDAVVAFTRAVRPAVIVQVSERRGGQSWRAPKTASGRRPAAIPGVPLVALNARGDVLAGWTVGRARVLQVAQHRIGTRWPTRAFVPKTQGTTSAAAGIDGRGRGIAVWGRDSAHLLRSATRSIAGRWTAAGVLPGSRCCIRTPLVVTPSGTAFVAANAGHVGAGLRVWRRPPGGPWIVAPVEVGEAFADAGPLAVNASGDAVFAWSTATSNAGGRVFAATYQASP